MKTRLITPLKTKIILVLIAASAVCYGQNDKRFISKFLTSLPETPVKETTGPLKYEMTAVYTNRDLYGNFTSKTRVTGDYTRGLPGDTAIWSNVFIFGSNKLDEPFLPGAKQQYMENFRYLLSSNMLKEEAFKNFPANAENVFARNLIWDMMSIETFAWKYWDSLKLNIPYIIPDIKGEFNMSDIGTYFHKNIVVSWKGISFINNEICAIIDYLATDNKIELNMEQIKTKGTEQYWGTTLVSLETKNIEHAVMYSGTIQEIEVKGLKDKFLTKTIRELEVDKIR